MTILFDLICKAKNFEETDNILGNSLNDNSSIELHGDVMAQSIGFYSESANLEDSKCTDRIIESFNNEEEIYKNKIRYFCTVKELK